MTSPSTDQPVALDEDIWGFLDEIDAPRWADLHEEAVLAAAGLEGDDPWFHTSHANHEKSLDELAEETGTITLPLLLDVDASCSPLRSPAGEPVASSHCVSGEIAADRAFLGSLHRVNLNRLGGGAKRLNIRASRVAQDEAFASTPPNDLRPDGPAVQSRAAPVDCALDSARSLSGEAWGTEVMGSMPPEANSSHHPSSSSTAIEDPEGGLPKGRRSTSSSGADVSDGRKGERSSGRGMQLPVAAEGRTEGTGDRQGAGSGSKKSMEESGSRRANRRSMGSALRVAAEEKDNPSEQRPDSEKLSPPPLPKARSRKSADSGSSSGGKIKFAFGRRVEQDEAVVQNKKQTPPSVPAHNPPPLTRLPDKQNKPSSKETGSGSSRGTRVGPAESRPTSAAVAKVGRSVAARTDSGGARTSAASGRSGEAAQRGPLATLASGNVANVGGRVAGKPQAGQQAKRVLGPRLLRAAMDVTAAPGRGSERGENEPRHIKASDSASRLRAEDLENHAPQSRPRSGEDSDDQDLAAMLAQHNRKFKSKPVYEPRMHSVRDTKQWESVTGKTYYQLAPEERKAANEEIARMKQART